MGWIESVGDAIHYIEDHITEDLCMEEIAEQAFLSPYYFQKGFSMLCGFTVGDYIRQRRLTLAGSELASSNYSNNKRSIRQIPKAIVMSKKAASSSEAADVVLKQTN